MKPKPPRHSRPKPGAAQPPPSAEPPRLDPKAYKKEARRLAKKAKKRMRNVPVAFDGANAATLATILDALDEDLVENANFESCPPPMASTLGRHMRAVVDICVSIIAARSFASTQECVATQDRCELSTEMIERCIDSADTLLKTVILHYDKSNDLEKARSASGATLNLEETPVRLQTYCTEENLIGETPCSLMMRARWHLLFVAHDMHTMSEIGSDELARHAELAAAAALSGKPVGPCETGEEWSSPAARALAAQAIPLLVDDDGNEILTLAGLCPMRTTWADWTQSDVHLLLDVLAYRKNTWTSDMLCAIKNLLYWIEQRVAFFMIAGVTTYYADMADNAFMRGSASVFRSSFAGALENRLFTLSSEYVVNCAHTLIELYVPIFVHLAFAEADFPGDISHLPALDRSEPIHDRPDDTGSQEPYSHVENATYDDDTDDDDDEVILEVPLDQRPKVSMASAFSRPFDPDLDHTADPPVMADTQSDDNASDYTTDENSDVELDRGRSPTDDDESDSYSSKSSSSEGVEDGVDDSSSSSSSDDSSSESEDEPVTNVEDDDLPTCLSEELLCGLNQFLETECLGMLDARKFRERLLPTVVHLAIRAGAQHRYARHYNGGVVPRLERPVLMKEPVTIITDLLTSVKKTPPIALLARARPNTHAATLMHVMDVMCNQHSRFEWKRNIVLFERDFFFDYEKALRDQLSPVICQHAGCWSVFFRCRYHHCKRGLVEAIALTTLIIVHSLRSLFPVGLQKHDLAFMRKWLVTWQRMGRIYLEQNPFNQTRFDPTFEPLTHVHSSLHNWFPKQWREMENRDSRKVLMSQMPHGFEPVELLSAFTKKPKKPELKVSMAS